MEIHPVGRFPALAMGAALACSAMAQQPVLIYSCSFDAPSYAIGSIDAQQSWVTLQATALAPGLTSMAVVSSGGPGAQAGNGFFSSTNGPDATTSGRFAFQARGLTATTAAPLVEAIRTAENGGATAIEFSAYITAPTPSLSGTTNVGARHGMVLYVQDPTNTVTSLKAACGFQVRAFDRQVYVVQWLDVGQLGVGTAGNYLINFTTPLLVEATGYTQVGCKWNRETGMPSVKVGAGLWTDVIATSTVNYKAVEFDIVNTRGSTAGGAINTVSTQAYMDTLAVFAETVPPPPDADGDGVPDGLDNCPDTPNQTQADCDGNGVGDACQAGFEDFNANAVPDYCECIADIFVDRQVNGADLGALLSQWGPSTATTASDLNRDGTVNGADLAYLLSNWGPCPN